MAGALGILPSRGSGPGWQDFYTQMDRELSKIGVDASMMPFMMYASRTNDAVLAIAHAISRVLDAQQQQRTDAKLQDQKDEADVDDEGSGDAARGADHIAMAALVRNQLKQMNITEKGFYGSTLSTPMLLPRWHGSSGAETCQPPARFDVVNQQNTSMVVVGSWDPMGGLILREEQVIFSDGRKASEAKLIQMTARAKCPPAKRSRSRR